MNAVRHSDQQPYFFWDDDISEEQIHHLIRHGSPLQKAWVISRILEYAKWEDIWHYLTLEDIRQNFERLHFRRPQDRELWAYALERWAHHD